MAYILVIEPNRVLANTYQLALEHVGHQVRCARSAQDAIHEADAQQPDLVVLELQLGAHDGVEFLHEFRSYSEWQNVPVIIHSAVAPTQLAPMHEPLSELGVHTVLYKPQTSLQRLISIVNQAVVPA